MNPILRSAIGTIVGAALGYAMYRFVGCKTGTCPITSNPWISLIFGGVLGFLFASGR